jgi:hypothetical protein
MPRGGHRPGAGRKPGSVNALTEKTRDSSSARPRKASCRCR